MFLLANRSRRYIVGMGGGMPLPMSASDISDVLSIYSSPLPIEELSTYIFALDSEFLSEDKPKQKDVESVWGGIRSTLNS